MKNALINGDSLDILKKLPDNSFDSMVTDPPAGIAFMGKKWDKDKGGRDKWIAWLESIMTEAFRTLKPGAHVLVWAIPRTSHWTATAIENAEFEIRDVVTHIFGSGFPKSQNISKAIDKSAGVKPTVIGIAKGVGKQNPEWNGTAQGRAENSLKPEYDLTVATSQDAKQWDGWGTALKPASEHWILARKPLSEKTIAANVLEHGTGGINIDASRINTTENLNGGAYAENLTHRAGRSSLPGDTRKGASAGMFQPGNTASCNFIQPKGRFPANLILSHKPDCKQVGTKEGKGYTINRFTDGAKPFGNGAGHPYEVEDQGPETIAVWECEDDCPVQALDKQSGTSKSTGGRTANISETSEIYGSGKGLGQKLSPEEVKGDPGFGDVGGASRFFYCAKASKSEKTLNKTIENKHPTVKSLKLMKYLINLVTPPGGVVLDPFMGSGTTGQAALEDKFGFVGIELEADSFEICKGRCSSIETLIINKKIEEKSVDQVVSV